MFWLFAAMAIGASLSPSKSQAQSYPVKPIRIVVGFTAGGGTDVTARLVAQKLLEQMGQPVVVENRPGAAGSIANERVAGATPDGYTLLMIANSAAVQVALRPKLPYDLERDFAPVSLLTVAPFLFVVQPSLPARSVPELIALARSQPGKLNYGSDGVGTVLHLAGELFNLMAQTNIVHVPHKGGTEAATATVAGQIEMSFTGVTSSLPLIAAGKLRALAVTSARRASYLPSVPTLGESLRGYAISSWYGMLAPAGVPKSIVARLNAEAGRAVNAPDMKEALSKQGVDAQTNTPEQFAAFIRTEIAQARKLIKQIGLKVE
jgi:tripartite-type tricarboxylate transporter receptor subunit TctC